MGLSFPNYPKLSHLHALIAIADSGSFSEAALRLQLSQSSVSYADCLPRKGDLCDGLVYEHCAQHGITLTPEYHVRSDATIVSMVAMGLGATISPRLAIEPTPEGVHVYALPVPLVRNIRVAILKESLLTPAGFTFLDLLREMYPPSSVEHGL